jgi:hypothetical protein
MSEKWIPRPQETEPNIYDSYPHVSFEPGNHAEIYEAMGVLRDFDLDWYATHEWRGNPELLDRLHEYQPEFVAIDSLGAILPLCDDNFTEVSAGAVWLSLPGNPRQLNDMGEVNVVAGDLFSTLLKRVVKDTGDSSLENIPRYNSLLRMVDMHDNALVAGASAGAIAIAATLQANELINRQMSRRDFLRSAALGSVGLIAGGNLFKEVLSYMTENAATTAKTQELKEQRVIAAGRYDIFPWDGGLEMDARTAILHMKTQEAMKFCGASEDTRASVILGYSHAKKAADMWESPEQEITLIREYMERTARIVDAVSKRHPKINKGEVLDTIFSAMAATEVYRVVEPPEVGEGDTRSREQLYNSVMLERSFESPIIASLATKIIEEFS